MNEYSGLIEKISSELNIYRELNEDENLWKARVVYSVMGRMALASLYDVLEDGETISVIHFKRRIIKIFEAYTDMFPELSSVMMAEGDEFAEEIYSIYLNCGFMYHTTNRLLPAIEKRTSTSNVEFIRGASSGAKVHMSGLGTYVISRKSPRDGNMMEMFNINKDSLKARGMDLIKNAIWKSFNSDLHTEFLRIVPPFSRGYWKDMPDKDGKISLMRLGERGNYIYYLYKYENENIYASVLPNWQVEGIEYRSVSNALLSVNGTLPSMIVEKRKHTVLIKQQYLLPPDLFYFLKLYSWPAKLYSVPSDFERVMNNEVFSIFEKILNIVGIEVSQ